MRGFSVRFACLLKLLRKVHARKLAEKQMRCTWPTDVAHMRQMLQASQVARSSVRGGRGGRGVGGRGGRGRMEVQNYLENYIMKQPEQVTRALSTLLWSSNGQVRIKYTVHRTV